MEADRAIKDRGIQIPLVHIDNSAGITEMKHTECDMVRQGITLYGLWPSDDVERCLDLKPAPQPQGRSRLCEGCSSR